ncbi:hypothetical protein LCGC14_0447750 [marine sediment metagenome]|uniref:Uncharacterized protein n=1 Tax=marine sediment metagenome TaxID=412755 RepID=A0A0F9SIH6_9ZZZZ
MACITEDSSKKIGGYDKWEVENAVRTMREAAEIEAKPKFLAVVVKEMNREADKLEDKADLLVKTSAKLKKVFGKKKDASV